MEQLIHDILEDARHWTDRYDLTIEWALSGDAPPGKTVQDMLTEVGVALPEKITPGAELGVKRHASLARCPHVTQRACAMTT